MKYDELLDHLKEEWKHVAMDENKAVTAYSETPIRHTTPELWGRKNGSRFASLYQLHITDLPEDWTQSLRSRVRRPDENTPWGTPIRHDGAEGIFLDHGPEVSSLIFRGLYPSVYPNSEIEII